MSETKHAMKLRHKAELKALQSARYTGIGAKKKQKDEEKALLSKHQQEIQQVEEQGLADEPSSSSSSNPSFTGSRAALKKAAKREKDAATRSALLSSSSSLIDSLPSDPRNTEINTLKEQLNPIHMKIKEIISDGHCLFRAIEDQIERQTDLLRHVRERLITHDTTHIHTHTSPSLPLYHWLRIASAAHIHTNLSSFLPFLVDESGHPLTHDEAVSYCKALADVNGEKEGVVWGGHIEIVALSEVLQHPIIVYSADGRELRIAGLDGDGSRQESDHMTISQALDQSPLRITFHKHYFGLGNHYNSVVQKEDEHDQDDDNNVTRV